MAYGLHIEKFQSPPMKLLLGALTLLPILYTAYFIAVYFFLSDSPNSPYSDGFTYLLFFGQWTIFLLYFVLFVSYTTHVSRRSFGSRKARFLWLLAFVLCGPVAMFAYWCVNIWPIARPVHGSAL